MLRSLLRPSDRVAGVEVRCDKGRIEAGCFADFVVWDPGKSFNVDRDSIQHRHKVTPYHGRPLEGVVKQTWLRGEKIADATGACSGTQGSFVKRVGY